MGAFSFWLHISRLSLDTLSKSFLGGRFIDCSLIELKKAVLVGKKQKINEILFLEKSKPIGGGLNCASVIFGQCFSPAA